MAKIYPALYEDTGYSNSLEHKMYLAEEILRGVGVLPTGADFIYHTGGSVNYSKPIEDSPHKSGRHLTNVIEGKSTTPWTLTTLFNINSALVAPSLLEIDKGTRLLFKSMYGREVTAGGSPVFDSATPPSTSFTIMEVGDKWAKQAPGSFVLTHNATFPGDGRAQNEWSGQSATALLVGCGKSIINNNAGATITVGAGEARNFPIGAAVMIIKANNAKSADTPAGTARTVLGVNGNDVLLSGAILADADGSITPVYLFYYEPEGAAAIDDPQVGLVGSITVAGEPYLSCIRSFSVNSNNNHEVHSNCFGVDGLGGPMFSNAGKLSCEISLEFSISKETVGFYNQLKLFVGEAITLVLGDAAGRHLEVVVPRARFNVPEISVPETGTIPITCTGFANQTALDAADEIVWAFI